MRKTDIRTIETRDAIKQAFLDLVEENGLVSVQAITKRAGKSRNTFYLHFSNLQEVQDSLKDDILKTFRELSDTASMEELNANPELVGQYLLEILKDEKLAKYVFCSAWTDALVPKIGQGIVDHLDSRYRKMNKNNPYARTSISFLTGGLLFALYEWYRSDRSIPQERLVERLGAISRQGVNTFK